MAMFNFIMFLAFLLWSITSFMKPKEYETSNFIVGILTLGIAFNWLNDILK